MKPIKKHCFISVGSFQLLMIMIPLIIAVYMIIKLCYSGVNTTLSIQVIKHLTKSLASQRPRGNAMSLVVTNTGI